MLDNQTIDDTFLEIVADFETHDEDRCESTHEAKSNPVCLVTPIARKHTDCDGKTFKICLNSLIWNSVAIANPSRICSSCLRPAGECWTILPL
jgi:hypothetical protein